MEAFILWEGLGRGGSVWVVWGLLGWIGVCGLGPFLWLALPAFPYLPSCIASFSESLDSIPELVGSRDGCGVAS